MSAKKPRFKPRVGYARASRREDKEPCAHIHLKGAMGAPCYKVRVTDARDLTADKAVAWCIETAWKTTQLTLAGACRVLCPPGYSARIVNGKARVRRAKQ